MATGPARRPSADADLQYLADIWWIPLLWGISAVLMGALLLAKPGISALVLVSVLAVFWLVGGVFDLTGGIAHGDAPGRAWRIVGGVIGILAGLAVLANPILGTIFTLSVLYYFVAINAILNGLINLFVGTQVSAAAGTDRSWGNFLLGLVQVILGVFLLFQPLNVMTLVAIVQALGICAIVGGILAIILAVRARTLFGRAGRLTTSPA